MTQKSCAVGMRNAILRSYLKISLLFHNKRHTDLCDAAQLKQKSSSGDHFFRLTSLKKSQNLEMFYTVISKKNFSIRISSGLLTPAKNSSAGKFATTAGMRYLLRLHMLSTQLTCTSRQTNETKVKLFTVTAKFSLETQ